jgi:hypothetical protein
VRLLGRLLSRASGPEVRKPEDPGRPDPVAGMRAIQRMSTLLIGGCLALEPLRTAEGRAAALEVLALLGTAWSDPQLEFILSPSSSVAARPSGTSRRRVIPAMGDLRAYSETSRGEAGRLLYVALTRARLGVLWVPRPMWDGSLPAQGCYQLVTARLGMPAAAPPSGSARQRPPGGRR